MTDILTRIVDTLHSLHFPEIPDLSSASFAPPEFFVAYLIELRAASMDVVASMTPVQYAFCAVLVIFGIWWLLLLRERHQHKRTARTLICEIKPSQDRFANFRKELLPQGLTFGDEVLLEAYELKIDKFGLEKCGKFKGAVLVNTARKNAPFLRTKMEISSEAARILRLRGADAPDSDDGDPAEETKPDTNSETGKLRFVIRSKSLVSPRGIWNPSDLGLRVSNRMAIISLFFGFAFSHLYYKVQEYESDKATKALKTEITTEVDSRIAEMLASVHCDVSVVAEQVVRDSRGPWSVIDGKSLRLAGDAFQLDGIWVPKVSQNPASNNDAGRKVIEYLKSRLSSEVVSCSPVGKKLNGAHLANCTTASGEDIATLMVSAGYALDCTAQSKGKFSPFERSAEKLNLGLWGEGLMPKKPGPECTIKSS